MGCKDLLPICDLPSTLFMVFLKKFSWKLLKHINVCRIK